MWSDNETDSDFIDFQHLVGAVTSIVDNDDLLPSSIGIFGDWGSGKSSLMKMVKSHYVGKDDTLIVEFNGWLFEGYEDTKTILLSRIVDEIIQERTLGTKAKKAAIKLLKKINYLKVAKSALLHGAGLLALGPGGLAVTGGIEAVKELAEIDYESYLKKEDDKKSEDEILRSDIHEFHLNLEELIQETGLKKVVVLIDDLDRCAPDTVISTLEAIKLFLFAKKTAFVIGADERLIQYAVRRRFPEIPEGGAEVARDYLEKLIQFPIRIPSLGTLELGSYIGLLFTDLIIDKGEFEFVREGVLRAKSENPFEFRYGLETVSDFVVEPEENLKEALSLSSQITPVLAVGLKGNPRQAKRFLNTMMLRQNMANSKGEELDKKILAKLMLLEYFKPETFRSFYKEQAENSGILPSYEKLEKVIKEEGTSDDMDIETLLKDDWIREWIKSEPSLTKSNLQSYYYFSRDSLSGQNVNMQRMSAEAQGLFKNLISETNILREAALKKASSLSDGDASAIFEAMAEKIRTEGKPSGEAPPIKVLSEFCGVRPELLSQLLLMVQKLPHEILPMTTATSIRDVAKDTIHEEDARKIIAVWSASETNKRLAGVAKRIK